MKLQRFENELLNCKIGTFINNDNEIYFRAKDVANYLQYANTEQAIRINVDEEDKTKLMTLVSNIKRLNDKNEIVQLFS